MMELRASYDAMKQKATKKDMTAPFASEERLLETVAAQFDRLWSAAE